MTKFYVIYVWARTMSEIGNVFLSLEKAQENRAKLIDAGVRDDHVYIIERYLVND